MRYCYALVVSMYSVLAYSQASDSFRVTYLKEVNVYGMPMNRYAAGSKIENINLSAEGSLLNTSLSNASSVYFKNYGNEQLSTIAFRGTSASHTAVLWNGMNVSSPTLGITDFSLLPVFLLEEVSLQYGTSSSLYGTDALGGSVLLGQRKPQFVKGVNIQAQQQAGSFSRFFSGLKIQIASKRWEFRTKIMTRTIENDFTYNSPAVRYSKKQNNASVATYGFDQQAHYKISNTRWISFEALHVYNFREIQPTVTNPVTNKGDTETLRDLNTRLNLSYQGLHALGNVFASIGYMRNDELYKGKDTSLTKTDQITAIFNADRALGQLSNFRWGGSASLFLANVENYRRGYLNEKRYDLFTSFNHYILQPWCITINLRQSFYAGRYAPLSPSLGTEYKLLNFDRNKVFIKSQVSRGYRVPTLNDRYWYPGGNPNLKPEDALHTEAGIFWQNENENHQVKAEVTTFKTRVDRWILWQQDITQDNNNGYAPTNLVKVNASGAELSFNYLYKQEKFSLNSGAKYSYTVSKNLKGLTPSDTSTIGKQLPYVPYHLAHAYLKLLTRKWTGEISADYTSLRYTTLNNNRTNLESLKAYAQINLSCSRSMEFTTWQLTTKFEMNNVFNTYYENIKNRAMPGRNINLTLIINYKNKQAK